MMQTTNSVNVSLLFGSGISIPAGYPTTEQITKQVLCARDVIRHTNGCYYISSNVNPGLPTDYVPRVKDFLQLLLREIQDYYSQFIVNRPINYEDLAFLASQIADSESLEYDNPAIKALIDKIINEIDRILSATEEPTSRHWSVCEIATESLNYIKDIAWDFLRHSPRTIDHIGMIETACRYLRNCDIFTLNHDTMIEELFRIKNIPYDDGFGYAENGVRYWNPYRSFAGSCGVRLYKLHGSVNWFRLRLRGGSWGRERVGIPEDGDGWHTRDADGHLQLPTEGRPAFLTGTFNKILDYTSSPYFDLHCAFMKRLRQTHRLVVCGYSFNDKATNRLIVEWLYERSGGKLVVCHPDPDGLRDRSRGAVRNKWDSWREQESLTILPKYIQQLSWNDVESRL